jgi:hypothetical protein
VMVSITLAPRPFVNTASITAEPTSITNTTVGAPPSSVVGASVADPQCFDDTFPAEQCCMTGVSKLGKSCWDATFTFARCCNLISQAPSAQTTTLSTTPPVVFSAAAVSTPAPSMCCADKSASCWSSAQSGVCNNGPTLDAFVAWLCPLSCGVCSVAGAVATAAITTAPVYQAVTPVYQAVTPAPMPSASAQLGSCVDASQFCVSWAALGYCLSAQYAQYMQISCKSSCGLCIGTGPTSCADKSSSCPSIAQSGACNGPTPDFYTAVRERCPLSCGICSGNGNRRVEATQSVPETEKSAQQGASDHGGSGSVALPISISVALVVVVGALGLFVYVRRLTPQKAHMTVESAVPQQSSGVKLEMQQAAHLGSFRLDGAGLVPEIWC